MNSYLTEKERTTPIIGHYDVIIVGGGISGIAAALSAKRAGSKVLLIEREFALGGLATLGLITIYLPLCDGNGNQISFGIAEELLKLSIQYGSEVPLPDNWKNERNSKTNSTKRYSARYSANMMALLCEDLLINEGVEILYGSTVCDCIVENHKINCIIVQNKSGRNAISAKSFIDATGDADIAVLANAETSIYKEKNALASWYYAFENSKVVLHSLGVADIVDENTDLDYLGTELKNNNRCSGVDANEITSFTINAHTSIREHFLKRGEISSSHNLVTIPTLPQLRMTRRIVGNTTLTYSEQPKYYADSIGMIGDWTTRGPKYEIPFSCLCSKDISNLLAVGRCISVDDKMWERTRVIPACAVTGEAAGVAASLSCDFPSLDIVSLQKILSNRGISLH